MAYAKKVNPKTKLKLSSVDDVAPKKSTIILYGDAASGKSTFASTFPGPYFIVPAISANEMKVLKGSGLENNIVVFDTITEMYEQVQVLAETIKQGKLPDCHTIVFDNLTSAQTLAEQELREKSTGDSPGWKEWGEFSNLWKSMLYILHQLPVHIIWITHSQVKEEKPQHGIPHSVGTFTLIGKSKGFIPSNSDMILYCETRDEGAPNPAFRVNLKTQGMWLSRVRGDKERVKKLPTHLGGSVTKNKKLKNVDPHYDDLAKLLGWPSQVEVEDGVDEQT